VLLLPWVMASAYCRLDRTGGSWLGLGIIIGAIGFTWIPELFLGRYRLSGILTCKFAASKAGNARLGL